jgi:ferredoxin
MRFKVVTNLCESSTICAKAYADVFDLDDYGIAYVRDDTPDFESDRIDEIASICPFGAIQTV